MTNSLLFQWLTTKNKVITKGVNISTVAYQVLKHIHKTTSVFQQVVQLLSKPFPAVLHQGH